jgi:GT2 family glycosyltransferase
VRREAFQEAGGLDEGNLAVSYNDVDFCLRLRDRGWRVLWTPYAVLDHLESITRGADASSRNTIRAHREWQCMLDRWGDRLRNDPAYNPNLTLTAEDFSLAFPPRVETPWRNELY